jgi:heme exporter protein B
MNPPREHWWGEVFAVLAKDVRSEARTRSAVSTILMFAVVSAVVIAFHVVTTGLGLTMDYVREGESVALRPVGGTRARAVLLAAFYWIILFFTAMAGLPRVFVKEEEMRTVGALRLAARPSAVFAGKLLFNTLLLEGVNLALVPLFLLFFRPEVRHWPLLLGTLALGAAAMAGTATILGAIVSRAGNRAYLMVVLGFAPLLPILVLGIQGTAAALHPDYGNKALALVSYLVAMTTVSALLFERVWAE